MRPELLNIIRLFHDNEATDAYLYSELARRTKSAHNKTILQRIAQDEAKHCKVWGEFVKTPPKVNMWKIRFFLLLSRIFGLMFTINLMEAGETKTIDMYTEMGKDLPVAMDIVADETRHEAELTEMIQEEGLNYISSMVLGLNDALVELTGSLAGFTLALNNNKMIGLAGFITGVAATLSMAASEYLARKANPLEKHPLKAAVYTGLSYLGTVVVLLSPYALTSSPLIALGICCFFAALIILVFTFFVSVVQKTPFLQGFREMITISFSVAVISFLVGWAARIWLNLDV